MFGRYLSRIGRPVRVVLTVCLVSLFGLALPVAADSGELGALISALSSSDRAQSGAAVEGLALRPEPQALAALTALRDGQLFVTADGQVLLQAADGMHDAVSGKRLELAPKSKQVVLNNTLRRTLTPALAALSLRSTDRALRLSSAQALSKSLEEKLVPALRMALAAEKDSEIHGLLAQAVAQADISSSDPALRLSAGSEWPARRITEQTVNLVLPPMTETLNYNGRGELIEDGLWTYAWDGAGRLETMTRNNCLSRPWLRI